MLTSNRTGADAAAQADAHRVREFDGMLTVRSAGPDTDTTTPDRDYRNGYLAAAPASGNTSSSLEVAPGSHSQGLDYDCVFFLWQIGPRGGPVPRFGRDIPVHVAGMVSGEGGWQLHTNLAQRHSGTHPGRKRQLIRGGGSAARISNELQLRWW